MTWTQPICELDWIDREGTFEPFTDEDRNAFHDQFGEWPPEEAKKLISIRLPVRIVEDHRDVEQCCLCGAPTVAGIFIRIDPSSVPYPREEEDE